MAKYIIGQTYKAFWGYKFRTFEVMDKNNGTYGILWDDGYEEWAYEADMDRWTEAAKEKEMEEAYK